MRPAEQKPVRSARTATKSSQNMSRERDKTRGKMTSESADGNEKLKQIDKGLLANCDWVMTDSKIEAGNNMIIDNKEERRVTRSMRKGVDTEDDGSSVLQLHDTDSETLLNNETKGRCDLSEKDAVKDSNNQEDVHDLCDFYNGETSKEGMEKKEDNEKPSQIGSDVNGNDKPTNSGDNTNSSEKKVILNVKKRKNRKVLKSKKGRKKGSKMSLVCRRNNSSNVVNRTLYSESNGNDFDIDSITSVTMINETSMGTPNSVGGSTNGATASGGGNSSRLAKLSWSKFDSYFRRIPMGTRKDIILKTIPINSIQRRFIIQELTNLEKALFTEPPWGKVAKKETDNSVYLNKMRLSLPPIYLQGCSLDSIVEIVSRSILKSSSRSSSGANSKPPLEINKPYFVLFELQNYLYMVALEPIALELPKDRVQNDYETTKLTESNQVAEKNPDLATLDKAAPSNGEEHFSVAEMRNENIDTEKDELNVKWDILGYQELSYYQFRYIERYLHDVFYNYDHSHKKVFFTPAKINDKQDLIKINMIKRMKESVCAFDNTINESLADKHENEDGIVSKPLFEGILNDYVKAENYCDTGTNIETSKNASINHIARKRERELVGASGRNHTVGGGSVFHVNNAVSTETGGNGKSLSWGSYRTYDPIYWWIDFVLPTLLGEDLMDVVGCNTIGIRDITKVYLQKDGLTDSYIEPPDCVSLGDLYWLDPNKPIKVVKQNSTKSSVNNGSCNSQKDLPDSDGSGLGVEEEQIMLVHPYMMNKFVENSDFNFVEANLERFLPIYNNIVDSITKMRTNIQNRIIHENENRTRMTDIPFIWMSLVQRYQTVNSWNKLKNFILKGYRDLYPHYSRQGVISKATDGNVDLSLEHGSCPGSKPKNGESLKQNSSLHLAATNVCSVCFNWETDTLRPFVECVRCGMVAHVGCYGVNIPLNELLDFYGWLCDRCEQEKKNLGTQYLVAFNPGGITCVLCSHSGGAFKRTNVEGEWVHLVCAVWHLPLTVCEDWKNLSCWNLDLLRRSWSNKKSLKSNRRGLILSYQGSARPEENETSVGDNCRSTSVTVTGKHKHEGDGKTTTLDQLKPGRDSSASRNASADLGVTKNERTMWGGKEGDIMADIKCEHGQKQECLKEDTQQEKEEWYENCLYCKNTNTLGLVSCDHGSCKHVYHPLCGWLNGVSVQVDEEPKKANGERLVEYIQGWRNAQDEALRLVSIRTYCRDHRSDLAREEITEEINLRTRRYINRDMFPDLFNSKYNQKSCRGASHIGGVIQRSRTRSISRSKSWDSGTRSTQKKSPSETYRQNYVYYSDSLTVDKYDRDICSICLKRDPSDYPAINLLDREMGTSPDSGFVNCICCGLVVHWSCYGIVQELERLGDFVCQTCQAGLRPERVSCVLCPRVGGALVRAQNTALFSSATGISTKNAGCAATNDPEKTQPRQKQSEAKEKPLFVHVICALYTPGIYLLPGGAAYGATNYMGMSSLVKLQTETGNGACAGSGGIGIFTSGKSKGGFARRFGGVEGTVQQVPFRNVKNEELFVFESFPGPTPSLGCGSSNHSSMTCGEQEVPLEVPPFYCCICKSSYGVNVACSYPGCLRTAHPSCLKLFGCCVETIAELSRDDSCGEEVSEFSAVRRGLDDAYGINPGAVKGVRVCELGSNSNGVKVTPTYFNSANVLYVSPNCQPPSVGTYPSYFLQRVYCPEHGKHMAGLNPGGRLLQSTLSSLKIANAIIDGFISSERIKKQLFVSQLDLMNRENPVFSPGMISNADALRTYLDCLSKGILQDSVKIKYGTIHRFKDGYIRSNTNRSSTAVSLCAVSGENTHTESSTRDGMGSEGAASKTGAVNGGGGSGAFVSSNNPKRTRSSGEAVPVPSLEEAIREARRQRELHRKELYASGIVIRKRPPPNRTPCVPFTRLDGDKLRECALNCLQVLGNSSKILNSFVEHKGTSFTHPSVITGANALMVGVGFNSGQTEVNSVDSLTNKGPDGAIGTFCIKQHRHDCFRKRIAEFILNPPVVMDHKRKTLRSLTRQLKMYGVTAEELMASDVPLPQTKSKPHSSADKKIGTPYCADSQADCGELNVTSMVKEEDDFKLKADFGDEAATIEK